MGPHINQAAYDCTQDRAAARLAKEQENDNSVLTNDQIKKLLGPAA